MPSLIINRKQYHAARGELVKPKAWMDGYQFSIKGSPRHFEDVKAIIEAGGEAQVYFGEPLTYERGAGVALWRIRAQGFGWLPALYDYWAEAERTEPITFTFHLYLPDNQKYPVLDLRQHTPAEVEAFIRANAPEESGTPYTGRSAESPRKAGYIPWDV